LKPITTKNIAIPGAAAYHQASGKNSLLSAIVLPHSGLGGGGPNPKNPRAAAVNMVPPMPIVVLTIMEEEILGSTCKIITLLGEAPRAIDAST